MTQTIAVSNQKGGVGKTTTSVNLAACLGQAGHPTLLIDLDPQSNATSACGLDTHSLESTIYDCLIENQKPTIFPAEGCENLAILPASMDLAGAEFELMDRPEREYALKAVIESILADHAGTFEYIIIDSPPSLGLLSVNCLSAADWILVPVQTEYLALEGLTHMSNTIQRIKTKINPKLEILGILGTMFDIRTNLSRQVLDELKRAFPGKVFETAIARSIRLSEAPSFGKPIIYYDPRSAGAEQYQQLCQEVLNVCEKARVGEGA